MNDNESIRVELRKINARADMQRKLTKWSLVFIAVFVTGMIIFAVVMVNQLQEKVDEAIAPPKPIHTWTDVDANVRRSDCDEAIRIGEELIQKMPSYPEGHQRLASAYLAAGKLDKAREHFAQAFQLFPTAEYEKLLSAIDKRMVVEKSPQSRPSETR